MSNATGKTLGSDIRLLGDLLGQLIQRLVGQEAFDLVEEVRAATKDLRSEPSVEHARTLRDRLGGLDLGQLRLLIRAFSVYFDLINLAEQQARVRVLRERACSGVPMSETLTEALRMLHERGVGINELAEHLTRAEMVPVFTAHPSEARRRTLLEKLSAIAQHLDELEYSQLTPDEEATALAGIAEEVEALWLTDTVRPQRPSVLNEVQQVLGIVEGRLFDVVPYVYRKFEEALARHYPGETSRLPTFLRFGSWIGGDRDGHPRVTHRVTAEAVRLHQQAILRHYLRRMDDLWRRLSHSTSAVTLGKEFQAALAEAREQFPQIVLPPHEPYRAWCQIISARLQKTLEHVQRIQPDWSQTGKTTPAGVYFDSHGLLADLRLLEVELHAIGASAAAAGAIRDAIRVVEVFGLHLMKLDLRQHSHRHAQAVAEVLAAAGVCGNYRELSPEERFDLLARELENPRPLIPTHLHYSDDVVEVIQTFRTMHALLEQQNAQALGTYIISSTTEPAHMLEVLLLARECRLFRPQEGASEIDIVPLFESLAPLQSGRAIMEQLWALPVYREQLRLRGNIQEIMIGYSDSNKESGFLQSAWALYRAQQDLSLAARSAGLTVQFFHGRGGAVGRGGGPANIAILAQPPGTVNGRMRVTEQGEMIADRYGHSAIAKRHLEQVVNAILQTSFPDESVQPDPEWAGVLDQLAEAGRRHYRTLVYDTPEFMGYFEQATCIGEIAQLKIGSRPARRGTATEIDQLRAIPWVFSWMQSRHTLPGWYGLGSAVGEFLQRHPDGLATLQTMYERWPFWRTLIDNAQMILAKADLTIARLYADLVSDTALADRMFDTIANEYRRSVEAVCQITQQHELLEGFPILKTSIERRNPYVDPLSFIQLVLLARLRNDPEGASEDLQTAVLESINGVAAGMKNTG